MTSPNTNLLSILRKSSSPSDVDALSLATMKTVQFGKNKQPLQVMKMVAITEPAWQKKTCFQNIASQAYNLATADHPVADIQSFVMEEMPTCTVSAFQEAEHVGRLVEKATLHIDNLFPLALLDSKEDELNVDVTAALDKRTEDIAFYKCRSTVDPTKVDGRIKNVGVFSTSFCLPLPYHIYATFRWGKLLED